MGETPLIERAEDIQEFIPQIPPQILADIKRRVERSGGPIFLDKIEKPNPYGGNPTQKDDQRGRMAWTSEIRERVYIQLPKTDEHGKTIGEPTYREYDIETGKIIQNQ